MTTSKLQRSAFNLFYVASILCITIAEGQETSIDLDLITASQLAKIPLGCIQKEYPNKLNQVLGDESDLKNPQALHPAFYGCFDWHSSVHGHWVLVKLLKIFPDLSERRKIIETISRNLTCENIQQEIHYFEGEFNKTFERTYGWAWLLKFAQELHDWDDPVGKNWLKSITPLAELISRKYLEFLPKLTYPIRTGEHPNTAFGLSLAYDYALSFKNSELLELILSRSRDYYLSDEGCPLDWEPNGFDFLSPCLEEANLMQKVLSKDLFQEWIQEFIHDFSSLSPAIVSDRSDPKIVHLDGLNFSRAWCLYGISRSMDEDEKNKLIELADEHFRASFPYLSSGNYEGEHWLTSFAILSMSSRP
jgi:hypothetical protein